MFVQDLSLSPGSDGVRKTSAPLEKISETVPIDWTPVWSLSDNQHKFLPSQLLYFQRPASDGFDRFFAFACSNGAAAGNNIEEAILQGFFEDLQEFFISHFNF